MTGKREAVEGELVDDRGGKLALRDVPAPSRGASSWMQELLDDWLSTVSIATLRAYSQDFADFSLFLRCDSPAEALATFIGAGDQRAHRIALAYKAEMMQRPVWKSARAQAAGEAPLRHGLAPRTINRRLAALRSIVKLARVGWKLEISGIKVKSIKDTSGISREAYLAMLGALEAELEQTERPVMTLRDILILRLWHDMALRRAEVAELDLDDVDLRRRRLRIMGKARTEEEFVPIPGPTRRVMKAYLDARGREPGPLLFSFSNRSRGRRLVKTSYNKILIRIVELANQDHANPHKLRHTAITRALDKTNGNIREVASFSRHLDPRTVMLYDDRRGEIPRRISELVAEDDEVGENDE